MILEEEASCQGSPLSTPYKMSIGLFLNYAGIVSWSELPYSTSTARGTYL